MIEETLETHWRSGVDLLLCERLGKWEVLAHIHDWGACERVADAVHADAETLTKGQVEESSACRSLVAKMLASMRRVHVDVVKHPCRGIVEAVKDDVVVEKSRLEPCGALDNQGKFQRSLRHQIQRSHTSLTEIKYLPRACESVCGITCKV